MKFTHVVWSLLCVGVLGAVAAPGAAYAETVYSSEYTITVTAVVLEHRTIIVDGNGIITQISSNTNSNITPEVRLLTMSGPTAPMTMAISQQYQHLMAQVKDNHIFIMDRQTPTINGLMPQLLLPISQRAYSVKPAHLGDVAEHPYTIYE
jgi:hypothetical protein